MLVRKRSDIALPVFWVLSVHASVDIALWRIAPCLTYPVSSPLAASITPSSRQPIIDLPVLFIEQEFIDLEMDAYRNNVIRVSLTIHQVRNWDCLHRLVPGGR
jgi:hypothetical protein